MSAEHSDRRNHHRQPRTHSTHWGPGDPAPLHLGADPAACPTCHPKETRA